MPGWVGAWVSGCLGGWVPGQVGAWVSGCLGGWVHKGVSEGVRVRGLAWRVGVCVFLQVRDTSMSFFPMHSFPGIFFCGFYSVGFSPWA